MGFKSFMQKIFGIKSTETASTGSDAKFLNGPSHERGVYTGELYANHLVRSIVHKIASYCSLMSFDHVRGYGKDFTKVNDNIHRLLTVKPNELLMTPSELIYKHMTDLWIRNNAYIWIKRDSNGEPISLLPIIARSTKMVESGGFLFYKFEFANNDKLTVYAGDIIHTRRYFYNNDWFGSDNSPLLNSVGLQDTMEVSLDASLKNGAQIKGILKHQNTVDPDDLKKHEELFRKSYLSPSNSGGIGMLDAKFDFIPITYSGKIIDGDEMKEIRDYVYRYFNMNDDIMMSKYNSDTWQSFHEGSIAPVINNFEQAMNVRFFTDKELGFGNRIQSSVNHITFMSPQQKINMVKLSLDGALYNRNEIRQWFGDSPIPGGDVYQYSKNFTEDVDQNPNNPKKEGDGNAPTDPNGN